MKRLFYVFTLLVFVLLVIAGCGLGKTHYKLVDDPNQYGITTLKHSDTKYHVWVKLNDRTPPRWADDYFIARARDLCGCTKDADIHNFTYDDACFRVSHYSNSPGIPGEIKTTREYDAYGKPYYKTERVSSGLSTDAEGDVECLKKE